MSVIVHDSAERPLDPREEIGALTEDQMAALAARGLRNPASLTLDEVRAVCASVLMRATGQEP